MAQFLLPKSFLGGQQGSSQPASQAGSGQSQGAAYSSSGVDVERLARGIVRTELVSEQFNAQVAAAEQNQRNAEVGFAIELEESKASRRAARGRRNSFGQYVPDVDVSKQKGLEI